MSMEILVEGSRLAAGAFATFFAILLWSRTREMAWTLVIVGMIVTYAGIVSETLGRFGIIDLSVFNLAGVPVVRMALADLPLLFFGAGFIAAVARRRAP